MKTQCKRGHSLSEDNVYIEPNGRQRCRECESARARAYYRTRKGRAQRRACSRVHGRIRNRRAESLSALHPGLNRTALGKLAEQQVAEFFREQGYAVEHQSHNAPFDLLVTDGNGGRCRVQVRTARVYPNRYVHVNRKKDPSKFDLFVTVLPDGTISLDRILRYSD